LDLKVGAWFPMLISIGVMFSNVVTVVGINVVCCGTLFNGNKRCMAG